VVRQDSSIQAQVGPAPNPQQPTPPLFPTLLGFQFRNRIVYTPWHELCLKIQRKSFICGIICIYTKVWLRGEGAHGYDQCSSSTPPSIPRTNRTMEEPYPPRICYASFSKMHGSNRAVRLYNSKQHVNLPSGIGSSFGRGDGRFPRSRVRSEPSSRSSAHRATAAWCISTATRTASGNGFSITMKSRSVQRKGGIQ
jgi:hypothetical protein